VPTYDYECRSCGRITEVIHSMSEEGPRTCEVCGGELRRVFHPAGIIFKGRGFYKTDSRSSSSATTPSSRSATTGGDGASSTAKPDGGSGTEAAPRGEGSSRSTPSPAPSTDS
jgi:putative FmdB family regulatory protein